MGARVLDEHPYHLAAPGYWLHDWGLQFAQPLDVERLKFRFEELFQAVWRQEVESDALNRLVLSTDLDARAIAVLRAYVRYFKQLGFPFSQSYIEDTLNRNPAIAQGLAELFALLPIPLACVAAFFAIRHVLATPRVVQAGYGWIVFGATVLIFVLAFLGLAYSIYPYIVIDRLTVWQAASATESLVVIGIGVAITLPAIIAYTIFMYRVFWGKARELTYGL